MKVFVIVNNYSPDKDESSGWCILADSSVTNTGKPFYKPDSYGALAASLSIGVRISRLGKHVESKFAGRYYSEYAPVLHFHLPEYEKTLREKGLPTDASRNFDRSLFIHEFRPMEIFSPLELTVNGQKVAEFNLDRLSKPIDDIVQEVSDINTIKMGDIILPGLSGSIVLKEGDLLEVKEEGRRVFMVKIK